MNKDLMKRWLLVFLIYLLLTPWEAGGSVYQSPEKAQIDSIVTNFAIQIAASKLYIDPDFFRKKFNLTDSVRFVQKEGWYKYVIGRYENEGEAVAALASLRFDAFVTTIPVEKDSSLPISNEVQQVLNESELRRLYNLKIRQADSAFNISKDLPAARELYLEATVIDPDKNYPADQIVEIDKKLTQERSKSIFAKLTLRTILLIFSVFIVLVAALIWFLIQRKRKSIENEAIMEEENLLPPEPSINGMKPYGPFSYLDNLQQPLTAWEQLKVYEMLKKDNVNRPDFSRWFNSNNDSIVIFSIKMARAFRQIESMKQMIPLLKHLDPAVREESILALGDLGSSDTLPLIIAQYPMETDVNKYQIIRVLAKIPMESNIEFLVDIVKSRDEFSLEAAMALYEHESFGLMGLEGLEEFFGDGFQDLVSRILTQKMSQ
jgi:hypothetical protein